MRHRPRANGADEEELEGRPVGWLEIEIDGHPVRTWILVGVGIALVVMGLGVWWTYGVGGL